LQTLKIPIEEVQKRMVDLKFKKPHMKKVLIFDLDETLAHCVRKPREDMPPQVFLNVVDLRGQIRRVGFNIRPFTQEVLEAANKNYEVCVFTASNATYADTVIDHIDPTGELI
jgi:TFIIF-interacting CTD phosphatase-like protein